MRDQRRQVKISECELAKEGLQIAFLGEANVGQGVVLAFQLVPWIAGTGTESHRRQQ